MLFLLTMHLDDDEKKCITQIYNDYRTLMMAIALRYTKNKTQAEDIVQEAFFKIRKNLSKISSLVNSKKRTYIIYIVKSVSIDYLRKQNRQNYVYPLTETIDIKAGENNSPDEQLFLSELRLNISKIISEMNERDSSALIGKYYYGYSTKELCDILKIDSQNTVLSVIYRARKKFIQLLKESEGNNE